MKKCLVVAVLALALSAGLARAEKSETPTLDRLRALMNDPRSKKVAPWSEQIKIFQGVLESYIPAVKTRDLFYQQCLAHTLLMWVEKNKKGSPEIDASFEQCRPDQDVLMEKYGASAKWVRSVPVWYKGEIADHALVDEADFEIVSQHKWRLVIDGKKRPLRYVRADIRDRAGKMHTVFMHRLVLGLSKGEPNVDHINHNALDNRRGNLRQVTQGENLQNVRAHQDGSSRYRGVSCDRHRQAWRAQVMVNGQRVLQKWFQTEREAAEAAAAARCEHMPFSTADQAA